jgi:hypothetical protein
MRFDGMYPRWLSMIIFATTIAMVVFMAVPFFVSAAHGIHAPVLRVAMSDHDLERNVLHASPDDGADAHQLVCPAVHHEPWHLEQRAPMVIPTVWCVYALSRAKDVHVRVHTPDVMGDTLLHAMRTVMKIE